MPTLNATVYPNEAYVLVQTDWSGAVFRDTFARVSATNWTPADTGQAYTIQTGAAANYSINGSQGVATHAAVGTDLRITAAVSMLDVTFSGVLTSTSVPVGGNYAISFLLRYVDANNFLAAYLFLTPTGVSCAIQQRIAAVDTFTGFPAIPALAISGVYGFTAQAVGDQVRFRAWDAATPEPATWNVTLTTTWLTAGAIGLGSGIPGTVTTPVPIIFSYDNLLASSPSEICPDYAGVTRRNTVTGEIVTLRPYVAFDTEGNLLLECCEGLWWDTEPPLNVPLEYCAVAADTAVTLTQNPGFETTTAPWVATGGALTQDCTASKVGSCSGRLTPDGTSFNPQVAQSLVTMPLAGVPVTLSTWAMSPQGWNSVYLKLVITYLDGTSETVVTPFVTLDDNEWRYLSITFTPRATVSSAVFSFIAAGFPPATTLLKVDELQVAQNQPLATTACETVTVASESLWLKNPLHPCLDVEIGLCSPMLADCEETARVSYVGMDADDYAQNTVLLNPVNRRRPVPINRVRRDATSLLRLLAHNCEARDAVLAANEPGDPLLFQAPQEYCIADRYMSVATVNDSRISVDQREQFRLISLPYAVVDRPEGPADGICGARIRDLCDIYTSWAALAMAGLTWTDLLLGLASPNGPGQPEPPAGARTWGDVEAEFANWLAVEAGGTRDWGELRDGL